MNANEARRYVDLIIEALANDGKLDEVVYGRMTEDYQDQLAEKLVEASEA